MKTLFVKPWHTGEFKRRAREKIARGETLNIMQDAVFKAVFTGDSGDSREALRQLLSCCTRREVSRVRVLDTELRSKYSAGKTVRLDVHVTFNDGEQADLEMQMEKSGDDLRARALLYASRLLSGQAKKGESYRNIKRVYQIFFLNRVLFPGSKLPRRYVMKESSEYDTLTEVMEIVFYELPKLESLVRGYIAGKETLQNLPGEAKWCIFMKYRHEAWAAPLIAELCQTEEGIMRAERALAKVSRDQEQWARALFKEKAEMDYYAELAVAREDGIAEGKTEGKLEIARTLKSMGDSAEKIQAATGLPPETIETL